MGERHRRPLSDTELAALEAIAERSKTTAQARREARHRQHVHQTRPSGTMRRRARARRRAQYVMEVHR